MNYIISKEQLEKLLGLIANMRLSEYTYAQIHNLIQEMGNLKEYHEPISESICDNS